MGWGALRAAVEGRAATGADPAVRSRSRNVFCAPIKICILLGSSLSPKRGTMKLVTFDDGKVGRVEGDRVVELDVPDMRDTSSGAGRPRPPARSIALADVTPARADHPEEVLPHRRQLPRARGGVEERQLVARDRAVDRLLPERRRDHRPRRADHLPGAPHRGARLRARAGRRHRQGRQVVLAEEAADYIAGYVIFNDITARDIQRREMQSGVFSFCKAIDTFCPLGPWIVTPDEIADPHDLAMELRVNGEPRQVSHSKRMSVTIPEIISHYSPLGYSAGDVVSTGTVVGRRRLQRGRRVAVPEARRRDGGRDRADRRAAQPGHLVGGGASRGRARRRRARLSGR